MRFVCFLKLKHSEVAGKKLDDSSRLDDEMVRVAGHATFQPL